MAQNLEARTRRPLEALNFFMADMQAGIGPFLGVFLLAHGWQSGLIGTVMTIGGVAGMVMTAPAGALVDATTHKRAYVIIPGICVLLASAIVLISQEFWLIALSQVATAIAGAAIGPAVTGITLGLVRQAGFNLQNGRNQAFNHAGNVVGAALSGLLGWMFGFTAVFLLAAAFGVLSIISVLMIPRDKIDDRAARGLEGDYDDDGKASGFRVLLDCKPLLILAAALALFHLGNGAMLPLYGIAVVAAKQTDPASFVAITIVVAQTVMIGASIVAMRMAEKSGYWLVLLISFVALPLRGLIAAGYIDQWGVYPVQMLDGIGAGLQSVAVPGLVARILSGTGRVNVGQGAVMTVQGLGASFSPALGGWIAEALGYGPMFLILGSFAFGSIALWLAYAGLLRAAARSTCPHACRSCRMTSPKKDGILTFAHIGDLHLTDAKQRNFADFLAIVAQIETELGDTVDFVVLPGDNADNGKPAQYALAATALKMLSMPVHVIAGDHDMEQGSLDGFYAGLTSERLPLALTVHGQRCLFVDVCGSGKGGPDFRLGADQLAWIETELAGARQRRETCLMFMHTYPDDLKGDGETEALNRLIATHDVALVDMGHTHYNELANDGRTIFAATRSTGQIEEGPVGYSLTTIDNGVVSWRFKPLDGGFPLVMITSPADHRLLRAPAHVIEGSTEVRALVMGRRPVTTVDCSVEDGAWIAMRQHGTSRLWSADLPVPAQSLATIAVRAVDDSGRPGVHVVRAATGRYAPPRRTAKGSDADSIGAWPENDVWGTQLGPNRNGKPS